MYEKLLRPLPAPSSMERPADAIVEQQYKKVLEALLLPPAAAGVVGAVDVVGVRAGCAACGLAGARCGLGGAAGERRSARPEKSEEESEERPCTW